MCFSSLGILSATPDMHTYRQSQSNADPPQFQGLLSTVLRMVALIGYLTLVIPPFTVL
jgi:hypothetical protein